MLHELEEKLKGFTSQLLVKTEKMDDDYKRNERLSCENSALKKEKETISSLNIKMESNLEINVLLGKQ